jgi:predicted metal-dependent hydrolase
MSIDQKIIAVNDLSVEVIKKDIKNIHVAVCPPNGRVRVATPLKVEDETVKQIVLTKMAWIKRQQKKFGSQERQTKREYVSGESHYFMGNRYRLNVIPTEEKPRIEIKRKTRIDMYIKPQTSTEKREELLDAFYRQALKNQIPPLLAKWEEKTGLKPSEIRIKKMKTKWGTCNQKKQRIWLNLELAKKPARCTEYVFVHEMVHLIEKNHTEKFKTILKELLPNWQQAKTELNRAPLGYSKWTNLTE